MRAPVCRPNSCCRGRFQHPDFSPPQRGRVTMKYLVVLNSAAFEVLFRAVRWATVIACHSSHNELCYVTVIPGQPRNVSHRSRPSHAHINPDQRSKLLKMCWKDRFTQNKTQCGLDCFPMQMHLEKEKKSLALHYWPQQTLCECESVAQKGMGTVEDSNAFVYWFISNVSLSIKLTGAERVREPEDNADSTCCQQGVDKSTTSASVRDCIQTSVRETLIAAKKWKGT